MFEKYTEEYFMEQAREMGQKFGVDTRQGSVYMDAATGHCIRVAKFYNDLDSAFKMMAIDTCTGEILDEKAKERNLYRKQATPAYYNVIFEGVNYNEILGERFFVDGFYFKLVLVNNEYYLMSEICGTGVNNIIPGSIVVPVKNIENLVSAQIGEISILGVDIENDEEFRDRYKNALSEPCESGNKAQYKSWCESFEGVGKALITPLWNGENTVKATLISPTGTAVSDEVVQIVQNYIDPNSEGLGNGVAPIGARVAVVSAIEFKINLKADVKISENYSIDSVLTEFVAECKEYFKSISLDLDENNVKYIRIAAILANVTGIEDYSNLLMNDSISNIVLSEDLIPVIGDVEVS